MIKKKPSRKEEIRQVAQNLFRERGYKATSMRDLASMVGIEPASLYNHYKSKAKILETICFDIAQAFFDAFQQLEQNGEHNDNPEIQLEEAIKAHVGVIVENLDASAVFLHEWRFMEEPALTEFIKMRHQYEKKFKEIIQAGIHKKQFKEIDVNFYSLTLFSAMNWIYDWYKPDGKLTAKDIGKRLTALLLDGIRKS